ncbi:MFS transporter [Streptomyces sp. GQFP]|uniref:MFS transporter n=1 Tax=Streptomyces sp. GQFP TaxID=2907545 RepID=UPI001F3C4610|nr:MFS transporter [Streptomyces sp. GQFP]UIX29234.1 MFS transporter [Streptomyces sp. GQFP]
MNPDIRAAAVHSAASKILRRVVPVFAVMMMCNQLNRSNIGYAQDRLEADLGIGAAAYGLGAGLFFITYMLCEVPSNLLMARFGAKIWLSRICVSWGIVSACTLFVQGPVSFYALRFLLGAAEAGFVPAVLYYFSTWLPNDYRGRANARYAVGALVAFSASGPLSGPLLGMDGVLGLHGWQWMFLMEGLLSVGVGVFAFFWLDSRIEDVTWLNRHEKAALTEAIATEEKAAVEKYGDGRASFLSVLRDPKIALFVFIYFATQMSIYANTFWLPSIVGDIPGTNAVTVGLLSSLPWLCAMVAMFGLARVGDRTGRRKPILVGQLLVAGTGTLVAALVSPWWALVWLCVAAMGFKSISPVFWPIVQRTVNPMTIGVAIAVINSVANLGGFVAPFGFGLVKEHTGSTQWALIALGCLSFVAAFACLWVRDRDVAEQEDAAPESRTEGIDPVQRDAAEPAR